MTSSSPRDPSDDPALAAARDILGGAIAAVYGRLKRGELLPGDLVPARDVPFSTPRGWIRDVLARKAVHEDDARILGALRRPLGAILDIGGHWGYMAASFRHAGTDCPILSFEPMAEHHASLDELRRLDGNFDFGPIALGDADATVTLYAPVISGQRIMGLDSVEGRIFNDHHRAHLLSLVGGEVPVQGSYDFRLVATAMRTRRLDDVLKPRGWLGRRPFLVDTSRIAALKLDIEGHEPFALKGAEATLARHRPMVMIESGNRNAAVTPLLRAHGYLYRERDGARLVEIEGTTTAPNGFWLHPSHMDEYRDLGLV